MLRGRPKHRDDLCWYTRRGAPAQLWLIIVDASASTRRHQALAHTKGLLATLFDHAYRQRARLALLTASGSAPQWQRHGLKASAALQPWLQALGAGGGTPLLPALEQARQWLGARRKAHPNEEVRCLVFTDGRLQQWGTVEPLPCCTLLVDMELTPVRLGRARLLAQQLAADYQHLLSFEAVK
ncbi:vWA domain-containing protein [Pseudomonas fulva]|uniref:vWA domain-containing protein n=1 Tax=Pseudomonas fulva TaxID=47880 RepID=UPI001E2FD68A|nr:VWA domain-containing protein [Pseudomonas fulva]